MLQVYALQSKISEYNNNVEVINYANKKVLSDYKVLNFDTSSIKKAIISLVKNILYFPKNLKRSFKFKRFKNNNLILSKKYFTGNEISKDSNNYEVIIVGSDQIWNNKLTGYLDPVYFLNFEGNFKRISYAASIGNMQINKNLEEKYFEYVNKLDLVSVRETAAKNMLTNIVKKDIKVVLDPVLILGKSKWEEKAKRPNISQKYIFTYEVGTSKLFKDIVNYSSKKLSLPITNLKKSNLGFDNVIKNNYTNEPFEFLGLILNSEYVITTSFHATVFSIIFNKNFWVLPPKDNSDRITNLLDELGLSNRYVNSLEELKNRDILKKIDFNLVNARLDKYIYDSIEFLKKSLDI